jgi:hypothetical protein
LVSGNFPVWRLWNTDKHGLEEVATGVNLTEKSSGVKNE